MTYLPKVSLINLIKFVPNGIQERALFNTVKKNVLNDYFNDTKHSYYGCQFYLGGYIKMFPDDEITLEKFIEARAINIKKLAEFDEHYNSFEGIRLENHIRKLNELEKIIKCYLKIGQLRELEN